MDNGAAFKLIQGGMPGHSIFYRLHGERGLMETGRGPGYWGPGSVRVVHEDKKLAEKRGRNDLCPCGSGKLFRNCCLESGQV